MLKPHITAMSAYKPPLEGRNHKKDILLDFNERTEPVAESLKAVLVDFITQNDRLHLYPAYESVVSELAAYTGLSDDQVMITNGSDQGIDLVFRSVARTQAPEAIIPGPSFAMYHQCALVEAMKIVEPFYTREEGYPVAEVLAAINDNTAIIVVANPNNPCGTIVQPEVIAEIARAAPKAAILVDECYFEYSRITAIGLIEEFDNIFVTRTFSKTWGLPSLRFGYLMSSPNNISALINVRGPYDINQLAVVAASAALAQPEYTLSYVDDVMNSAKPRLESWLDANKVVFWPSRANYLWVFVANPEALNAYLMEKNIRVRPKAYKGQMGLRITIGTSQQVDYLIESLEGYLAGGQKI